MTPAQKRAIWNTTKPMWVIGTIDSYGSIVATPKKEGGMHTNEDRKRGRCFRYNVWDREFHPVLDKARLTEEEEKLILDWLDKMGYIYHHEDS
jgi:hypothetical protein